MKEYKIIFSDIDGTLLNNENQVPEETIEELRRLDSQGVPFVLVSARMPKGMRPIREELGIHAPMVCYSGGLVLDPDDQEIYSCLLDLDLACEIKSLVAKEFPEVVCGIYGGEHWVVDDIRDPWVIQEQGITHLIPETGDIREIFGKEGGIHKFLFMGDEEAVIRTENRLKERYPQLSIARSKPVYLEVMNGNVCKSAGVKIVCEKYDIPLIVDNAHGAYQAFLDEEKYGNIHPIKSGAAICCDSAHKTLPVLTGGAYIHVSRKYKERFAPYVASYMTMFGSTSPSYLIMQSLDMCNRYIDEKIRHELSECIGRIEKTKKVLVENNVKIVETEPLKIVIDTAAAGMEGDKLAEEFRKHKIECEYADKYFVVLMITPQNDEKDFERLEKWAVETKYKRVAKKKIEPKKLILHRAERVMSIRKAAFSPYRKIKVSDAGGSICASQTIACPPAIPIAVCGERIDQNMISIFEEYGIDYVNVVSY